MYVRIIVSVAGVVRALKNALNSNNDLHESTHSVDPRGISVNRESNPSRRVDGIRLSLSRSFSFSLTNLRALWNANMLEM